MQHLRRDQRVQLMVDLVSIILGWIVKKGLDLLWVRARRLIMSAISLINGLRTYGLYHRAYVEDLENKAASLELLLRAYEQLPVDFKGHERSNPMVSTWRQ